MIRFFPIMISVILMSAMIFTGCDSNKKTTVSVKDAYSLNYDLIAAAPENNNVSQPEYTFTEFTDTVSSWANENEINVDSVSDTYLVLSKKASGELKNVESFTFHTCIDFSSEESSKNSLSTAATVMTALSSAQNHGPVRGIFTLVKKGQPIGAAALNSDYLDHDNFIDVTYNKDTVLYNTFAASSDMSAVKELDITSPTYTKAYKIVFKGVKNQNAYKNRGTYPNPVKTIGDLLASCQTSTVLFELASFNGGLYSDQIPGKVAATIVLHENDVESFTKKFNNSYKKIEEIYEDIDDDTAAFEYTMKPVDLPDTVISKEDTENIVSLMYTMINGTYLRNDNDEVEAFSNIGRISTKNGYFKLNISARSLDDQLMDELEAVVKTICGLSDIGYKKISDRDVWTNSPENPLVQNLSEELNAECQGILEMKHINEFTEPDNDINLISWGTNENNADKDLEKIFEYMSIAGVEIPNEN